MLEERKVELIENFKNRNIEVTFFDTLQDVKETILDLIPRNCAVGIGNSSTLKDMNISQVLSNRGNIVYDKTLAESKEESITMKKKALLTEWYITGINAISIDGHIVNIDHSGNRVAAMIFGPNKDRVCFNLAVIEGQYDRNRMKLFIVNENHGF